MSSPPLTTRAADKTPQPRITRFGLRLSGWTEHWFPDPLVFAFLAIIIVFALALLSGEHFGHLVTVAGGSFWALVPFTMQMVMIVIGGHVVATSAPVRAAISCIARIPHTPPSAVALIATFSIVSSLLSWGLSLIFSGHLTRELARRMPSLDYRAAGSAAYLGLGVTWALGLSSSAAMLMATPSSLPASLRSISGVIPLTQTLLLWQNLLMIAVLGAAAISIAYLSTPSSSTARTAADLGVTWEAQVNGPAAERPTTPGEFLSYSPLLSLLIAGLLLWYLIALFIGSPRGITSALDLNTYNLIFITVGLLLHVRPANFVRAVAASVSATSGVLIQFPFYAMTFGIIAKTSLSSRFAHLFVSISSDRTYPLLVAAYSSLLGVFVPSGGSKWVIEAPYVLEAAHIRHLHLGWAVQIYNAAEALPNLINPFWMLPLIGILKCRARDLVGYGMLQFTILLPLSYLLCWLLALTFHGP